MPKHSWVTWLASAAYDANCNLRDVYTMNGTYCQSVLGYGHSSFRPHDGNMMIDALCCIRTLALRMSTLRVPRRKRIWIGFLRYSFITERYTTPFLLPLSTQLFFSRLVSHCPSSLLFSVVGAVVRKRSRGRHTALGHWRSLAYRHPFLVLDDDDYTVWHWPMSRATSSCACGMASIRHSSPIPVRGISQPFLLVLYHIVDNGNQMFHALL